MFNLLDIFRKTNKKTSKLVGKQILIVDDGEVERKFISHTLEKLGCVVTSCADGDAALAALGKDKFDLAVLDFYLPRIGGKDICLNIKNNPRTKHIPVIFLTGSASPNDLIDCYEAGAEYYLSKPISGDHLVKQVRMIFHDIEQESGFISAI